MNERRPLFRTATAFMCESPARSRTGSRSGRRLRVAERAGMGALLGVLLWLLFPAHAEPAARVDAPLGVLVRLELLARREVATMQDSILGVLLGGGLLACGEGARLDRLVRFGLVHGSPFRAPSEARALRRNLPAHSPEALGHDAQPLDRLGGQDRLVESFGDEMAAAGEDCRPGVRAGVRQSHAHGATIIGIPFDLDQAPPLQALDEATGGRKRRADPVVNLTDADAGGHEPETGETLGDERTQGRPPGGRRFGRGHRAAGAAARRRRVVGSVHSAVAVPREVHPAVTGSYVSSRYPEPV